MKIPTTVISGFLGAGKTTLVRHLLEQAHNRRIALIINEFGDLGIDKSLVEGCGIAQCPGNPSEDIPIVELANGCICCTVADEFLPVMEALLAREVLPDHVIIETSGLALPTPLVKAFSWPEVRSKVTIDGVIVVVDGPAVFRGQFAENPEAVRALQKADTALDHHNPLHEVFEDQLQSADMIILGKGDQLAPAERDALHARLKKKARKGVRILSVSYGRVPFQAVLGLTATAQDIPGDLGHHETHDHDHIAFDSFSFRFGKVIDPATLEQKLIKVVQDNAVLRVKGFLHISGKPMRHVIQGVGERFQRYYDRPWKPEEKPHSELVLIGLEGMNQEKIKSALLET